MLGSKKGSVRLRKEEVLECSHVCERVREIVSASVSERESEAHTKCVGLVEVCLTEGYSWCVLE